MILREATPADLPHCETGAREFYASSKHLERFRIERFVTLWTQLLEQGAGKIWLLEDDGIVGALGAVLYPDPYSGALIATEMFWFVSQEHRGRGMELYRKFEQWAKGSGCRHMRMVHLLDSMPAKLSAVYRRLGYTPAETHYTKEIS